MCVKITTGPKEKFRQERMQGWEQVGDNKWSKRRGVFIELHQRHTTKLWQYTVADQFITWQSCHLVLWIHLFRGSEIFTHCRSISSSTWEHWSSSQCASVTQIWVKCSLCSISAFGQCIYINNLIMRKIDCIFHNGNPFQSYLSANNIGVMIVYWWWWACF